MARTHARIQFGMWRKDDHGQLSKDARWLYVTLLADEALNQAGVVVLRPAVWAEDAAMTDVEVKTALEELIEHRFVGVDERTAELLVRTFVRNDGVAGKPNVLKNALAHATMLRSKPLRKMLADELRKLPPKPPDTDRMRYPDPHATAEALDPGGSEQTPEPTPPNGSGNPSTNGSPNMADNPSPNDSPNHAPNDSTNPSNGTVPGTYAGTSRGRGRGSGRGTSPADGDLGGRAHTREDPPPAESSLGERPADRCPKHTDDDDPPPCRRCGEARERTQQWDRAAHRAAVTACRDCSWCDPEGWRIDPRNRHRGPLAPGRRCDHTPLSDDQLREIA